MTVGVDARYVIVGHDAGDRAEAERRVSALGLSDAVSFAGGVPASEVAGWYEAADVYVLPAVDEPFPLTVLEAMRAGVPVVVTDRCGISSALERAGAALVSSPDPASLSHHVRADTYGFGGRRSTRYRRSQVRGHDVQYHERR